MIKELIDSLPKDAKQMIMLSFLRKITENPAKLGAAERIELLANCKQQYNDLLDDHKSIEEIMSTLNSAIMKLEHYNETPETAKMDA